MSLFIYQVATIASRTLIVILFGADAATESEQSIVTDACNLCWIYYAPLYERNLIRSVCRQWSHESYVWRLRTRLKLSLGRLIIW